MKNKFIKIISLVTLVSFFTSCTKTLDRKPFYDVTSATVYDKFSNYKGLDPEIPSGIDNNFYPRPRTYSLGFNLDF